MYVLLVSHGPRFIEMPSLHTAKSNKSWLFSLAGCLGSDVRVCNPRPEECKRVLSPIHLGWGKSWKKGREDGWSMPGLLQSTTNEIKRAYYVGRCSGSLRIGMFPTPPAKMICLTFCLTGSEAIKCTASAQLAINLWPELD